MSATVKDAFDAVLAVGEAYNFERKPSEVLGEATLPGFGEVCEAITQSIMYGVSMAVMGIAGPDETEENVRESIVATLATGVRAGSALAVGDLDLAAEDLDSLDDGLPDGWE